MCAVTDTVRVDLRLYLAQSAVCVCGLWGALALCGVPCAFVLSSAPVHLRLREDHFEPIVYFAASFCDILLQLRQWRNAPTPPAACRHQPRGHTHTHTDTYDLAPELSYHTTYAPHTPRCCVPLLLAEETCVEPVLARVVQVLVKIDHVVLHTCACTRLAPVSASRHGGTLGHGTHRALERAPVSPVLQRARIALVPARSRC